MDAGEIDLLELLHPWSPPAEVVEVKPEPDIEIEISSNESSTAGSPASSRCFMINLQAAEESERLGRPCSELSPPVATPDSLSLLGQCPREIDSLLALPELQRLPASAPKVEKLGVVWALVRYFHEKERLDFSRADLDGLIGGSSFLRDGVDLIPLVVVTIQTVATLPQNGNAIEKWREESGNSTILVAPLRASERRLRPWDDGHIWNFRAWILAMEISHRFFAQKPQTLEEVFLASLTDLIDPLSKEWWKVEVITLTLHTLKRAAWFWPLLMST